MRALCVSSVFNSLLFPPKCEVQKFIIVVLSIIAPVVANSQNKMRLRGCISKVLCLTIACGIILLIYSNFTKKDENEFLTHLPDSAPVEIGENLENHNGNQIPNTLLNFTQFMYKIPNNLCSKHKHKDLLGILIVTSYAGHDNLRAAHRQAVPQKKLAELGFQRVFLLAALPSKERFVTQGQLENEQQRFDDLLQGNFVEAYRNLSYKHIMGLNWAATSCSRAKFIIKLDDDIIYDVFQLRRYLEALEIEHTKLTTSAELLSGFILDSKPPIRNLANKWYVAPEEYSGSTYPAYLSGWLYITNGRTALRLVREAQIAPFFWIDDTWITGVLRQRLKISMQRLNSWYSANSQFIECCVEDLKKFNFECEYYVGPNGGDIKLLIEFLHNVEKCYFDECIKRPPDKSLKLTCVAKAKRFLPAHGAPIVKSLKLR